MKKTFFVLFLALATACSVWSQPVPAPTQAPAFDYDKFLEDRYNEVAVKPSVVETWTLGLLAEYGLVFDHLQFQFTKSAASVTTDGKYLICGRLLAVAYARTKDGEKKRLIQDKQICHIFANQVLEKTLTIDQKDHVIKNGWDDGVSI